MPSGRPLDTRRTVDDHLALDLEVPCCLSQDWDERAPVQPMSSWRMAAAMVSCHNLCQESLLPYASPNPDGQQA